MNNTGQFKMPSSESSLIERRNSMLIRRSEMEQDQLEGRVSHEHDGPSTGPTTIIPPAIQNIANQVTEPITKLSTTTLYYYKTIMPAIDAVFCAINQYKREHNAKLPARIFGSIRLKQQISEDMQDVYGQDFNGCTVPSSPYQQDPNIPIYFQDEIPSNCIVCMA